MIFISYAKQDYKIAKQIYNDLKKTGLSPWLDKEDITVGENWKLAIRNAILKSSYFIALFSSNSVSKKGYVQKELKMAIDILDEFPPSSIFIIPVRLNNCNIEYERITSLQWVDIFNSYEEGLEKIVSTINKDNSFKSTNEMKNDSFKIEIIKLYNLMGYTVEKNLEYHELDKNTFVAKQTIPGGINIKLLIEIKWVHPV